MPSIYPRDQPLPAACSSRENDIFHFSIINLPFSIKLFQDRGVGTRSYVLLLILLLLLSLSLSLSLSLLLLLLFYFYFILFFILFLLKYHHYHYRYRYCYRHHYSFNIKDISFILQQIHWLERRKRKKKTKKVKILFQIFRQSKVLM